MKIYDVNNSNTEESNEDRVLYRLTIDMRAVNTATKNDTSIVLPTIETIERSFHSSIISTFDISNMFYNVAVHKDSMMKTKSGPTEGFHKVGAEAPK